MPRSCSPRADRGMFGFSLHDPAALETAERVLGHRFSDHSLLRQALTHPSVSGEESESLDYERLELLGDAVINLVVVEEIYRRFTDLPEGQMTKLKISVVAGSVLSQAAADLGLADLIVVDDSEIGTKGRGLRSALENAFEAVVGAIYLDGGLDSARSFLGSTLGHLITPESLEKTGLEHPKSRLQEIAQGRGQVVAYRIVTESGPPHDRRFEAQAELAGRVLGTGTGSTKKEAEMMAAAAALSVLEDGLDD